MTAHKSSGGVLKKIALALLVIPISPIILLVHAMKRHGKNDNGDKGNDPPTGAGATQSNERGTYGRR